jgi:hypothetical protein
LDPREALQNRELLRQPDELPAGTADREIRPERRHRFLRAQEPMDEDRPDLLFCRALVVKLAEVTPMMRRAR